MIIRNEYMKFEENVEDMPSKMAIEMISVVIMVIAIFAGNWNFIV